MPLSATEKNLIAPPGVVDFFTNISTEDVVQAINVLPSVLPFPINIFSLPLVQGLTLALTPRIRFPRISPGQVSQEILNITRGTGGRAPAVARVTSSPFELAQIISNRDQDEHLTGIMRDLAVRNFFAQQDTSRAFLERRAVIEGLAESAQERGFASTIDPNLRGAAFRATADSPVQFIERNVFL